MTPRGININLQNIRQFPRVVLCLVLISCINFGGTNISAKEQELSDTWKNLAALNEPGMEDKFISVNFDQVDIRIMLKTIGDITGTNFIVDDAIQGKVTVMSPGRIRLGEIFKVLESVLEVNDYAAIVDGDFVRIVPNSKAIKQHRNVRVGGDPARIPQGSDYVTQIIPLQYANVGEISDIINPLLAAGSYMSTYPKTNSIIITGNSSNIHHIAAIIQKLDTQGIEEHVEVITLEHASSEVLAEQIMLIMEQSQTSSRVSGRRTTGSVEEELSIIPDGRTNSLVVVGDASKVAKVKKLVTKLDIQRPNRANNVHVIYLKNAPAKETSESLNAALGNLRISGAIQGGQHVQVTADEGTNALIITASAQDYEIIAEIVEKLDIVREQVLVEMLIMEVSQDALQEIGIDWATIDQAVDDSIRFFGGTNFGIRSGYPNSEGFSLGMWKNAGGETQIGAILNALEKETGVNILSTPHIMTSNHQRASIIVGENRPYVTDSRITETDPDSPTVIKTYDYRDVGISLEIVPHISHENHVRLEIKSEFTKLIEDVSTSADTPTTAKRQAETVVSMNSASTVVIGGLIRDDKTTVEKKVPLVGDIPVLGELFKYKKDQVEKTNLLIFITPYVMNTQEDMDRISEKKRIEMDSKIKKIMEPEDDAGIGKNTPNWLKPDGILEVDG